MKAKQKPLSCFIQGEAERFEISECKLVYIGWINKVLLYSTGNRVHYPEIKRNEKEYEKNARIPESLRCTAVEMKTTL